MSDKLTAEEVQSIRDEAEKRYPKTLAEKSFSTHNSVIVAGVIRKAKIKAYIAAKVEEREKVKPLLEIIEMAKSILSRINEAYGNSMYDQIIPEDERKDCNRCGGMLYIEQGGDVVDCHVCKGTGMEPIERLLNADAFAEAMEDIMFHSSSDFYEVLTALTNYHQKIG